MSDWTTSAGIWKGWYWRYVSLTILAIAVLQVIAFYVVPYDLLNSLPIAVLSISYLVILKVKERRLANALVAVALAFVLGVVLQLTLEYHGLPHGKQLGFWLQSNGWTLLMGGLMAYAYLRLTQWSEKKRTQLEAKRKSEKVAERPQPQKRNHKKRKGKRR